MKKLVDVLVDPKLLLGMPLSNLSLILAEARYFNMLAQLEHLCQESDILSSLPEKFQQHLASASLYYQNQCKKLNEEVSEIHQVLAPLNIDWMYLKGSAYYLSNIKAFTGRMMGDIDLLVEEKDLAKVEKALQDNGWLSKKISNYDEKFYRNWSQEIPPLKHIFRQVDLDVHFNILPKTIKESLEGRYLFIQSTKVDHAQAKLTVLKPHAMLVHSAIHLFYESDFRKGLRDLYDIAIFIKMHGHDESFWQEVIKLQNNIGNLQCLFLALRYTSKVYKVSIPDEVLKYYDQVKPQSLALYILDQCFMDVFTSTFPPYQKMRYRLSSIILYLRGHAKRMPIKLLLPHLTRKSLDKFKLKEGSQGLL